MIIFLGCQRRANSALPKTVFYFVENYCPVFTYANSGVSQCHWYNIYTMCYPQPSNPFLSSRSKGLYILRFETPVTTEFFPSSRFPPDSKSAVAPTMLEQGVKTAARSRGVFSHPQSPVSTVCHSSVIKATFTKRIEV
jgi:hypothetical protein